MNKDIEHSRLNEKIIDVILPLEIVYEEDEGETVPAQLRHGRLNNNLSINKNTINTRYGKNPLIPQVKVYFRAFTDTDSVITIDIYNKEYGDLFKKFIIKSSNNDFTIDDMKNICNEIKNKLFDEESAHVVDLIKYIRSKENLIFEEIAQ